MDRYDFYFLCCLSGTQDPYEAHLNTSSNNLTDAHRLPQMESGRNSNGYGEQTLGNTGIEDFKLGLLHQARTLDDRVSVGFM